MGFLFLIWIFTEFFIVVVGRGYFWRESTACNTRFILLSMRLVDWLVYVWGELLVWLVYVWERFMVLVFVC